MRKLPSTSVGLKQRSDAGWKVRRMGVLCVEFHCSLSNEIGLCLAVTPFCRVVNLSSGSSRSASALPRLCLFTSLPNTDETNISISTLPLCPTTLYATPESPARSPFFAPSVNLTASTRSLSIAICRVRGFRERSCRRSTTILTAIDASPTGQVDVFSYRRL